MVKSVKPAKSAPIATKVAAKVAKTTKVAAKVAKTTKVAAKVANGAAKVAATRGRSATPVTAADLNAMFGKAKEAKWAVLLDNHAASNKSDTRAPGPVKTILNKAIEAKMVKQTGRGLYART